MKELDKEFPCFKGAREGKCGCYQKLPHPILVCSIDQHEVIDIVGGSYAFEELYKNCPLKEGT